MPGAAASVPESPAPAVPANPPSAPTFPGTPAPVDAPALAPVPGRTDGHVFDTYALVGTALSLRGIPYRNGGNDPQGFDCSGFTRYVFSQYGIALPRDVRSQYLVGAPIEPHELSPGDLVFFATTDPDVSHVAIAIGGDEFVHAPSTWGVVRVEHLNGSYWSRRYIGARRVAN